MYKWGERAGWFKGLKCYCINLLGKKWSECKFSLALLSPGGEMILRAMQETINSVKIEQYGNEKCLN